MAIALGRPLRGPGALPARHGDRDRPRRPPLFAGLDLRLDRRPDARLLGGGWPAFLPPPAEGLAADHLRAARVRPASGNRRREVAADPLAAARRGRQDPGPRAGAHPPPPGRALHPGAPALLGLRRLRLLVLSILRDAARRGRNLALPLSVVPPLRCVHR